MKSSAISVRTHASRRQVGDSSPSHSTYYPHPRFLSTFFSLIYDYEHILYYFLYFLYLLTTKWWCFWRTPLGSSLASANIGNFSWIYSLHQPLSTTLSIPWPITGPTQLPVTSTSPTAPPKPQPSFPIRISPSLPSINQSINQSIETRLIQKNPPPRSTSILAHPINPTPKTSNNINNIPSHYNSIKQYHFITPESI